MFAALLSSVSFVLADPALASAELGAPVVVEAAAAAVETKGAPKEDLAPKSAGDDGAPANEKPANEKPAIKEPAGEKSAANPARKNEPTVSAAVDLKPAPAAGARVVFGDLSDEAVAERALQYIEGLGALSGDFIQTAPSGAVSTGKFYMRRPGQARFDYDAPTPLKIVATQGLVYVQNEELETTDSYPLKKTPLRFLLSKKIDLSDARLAGVDRDDRSVAITWASRDEENAGDLTLELAAPDFSIERWAVRDPQNGVTVVDLQNVESGVKLANRLFAAPEAGGAFINK